MRILGIRCDVRQSCDTFKIVLIFKKKSYKATLMNSPNIVNITKCINVNSKTSYIYTVSTLLRKLQQIDNAL